MDLYFLHRFEGGKSWVTTDLAYSQDFSAGQGFGFLNVVYGQMIIASVSVNLNASVAFGQYRPYQHSLGVSFNVLY
jgi:hypothetical protein